MKKKPLACLLKVIIKGTVYCDREGRKKLKLGVLADKLPVYLSSIIMNHTVSFYLSLLRYVSRVL